MISLRVLAHRVISDPCLKGATLLGAQRTLAGT